MSVLYSYHQPEDFRRLQNIRKTKAKVKYSVTFQNLKAGGTNIWLTFINNKQYYLIQVSRMF